MIQIELPHVNILSKIDLLQQYDQLGIVSLILFMNLSQHLVWIIILMC